MADSTAAQAGHMLDLWSQLAMRHVSLGSACACGTGGGISLRLHDFELDIAGYLEDQGQRCGIAGVEAFFQADPPISSFDQPLRRLLDEVMVDRLPREVAEWLMPKVERTLRSCAEQHRREPRG